MNEVTIQIYDSQDNLVNTLTTDTSGEAVETLNAGDYRVTAELNGFQDEVLFTSDSVKTVAFRLDFVDGSGTSGDPYQIESWYHLDKVRDYGVINGGNYTAGTHFVLNNNLNQNTVGYDQFASSTANSAKGWQPVGYGDNSDFTTTPFTGNFDGNGYQINDINIDNNELDFAGLFGVSSGTIENLAMSNVSISVEPAGAWADVGALLGYIDGGTVNSCYVENGSVTSTNQNSPVGGLVGYSNGGNITDCYTSVTINSDQAAGGLTGGNSGTISNSYASGSVNANFASNTESAGGLVGYNTGEISNSYASGDVNGYNCTGGLVGNNYDSGYKSDGNAPITNSYATANVTGTDEVGGLVGYNRNTIENCYSTGVVDGNTKVGALVGNNMSGGGTVIDSIVLNLANSTIIGDNSGQLIGRVTLASTADMQNILLYTDDSFSSYNALNAPWDITDNDSYNSEIWKIDDGNDYPRLGWQ